MKNPLISMKALTGFKMSTQIDQWTWTKLVFMISPAFGENDCKNLLIIFRIMMMMMKILKPMIMWRMLIFVNSSLVRKVTFLLIVIMVVI